MAKFAPQPFDSAMEVEGLAGGAECRQCTRDGLEQALLHRAGAAPSPAAGLTPLDDLPCSAAVAPDLKPLLGKHLLFADASLEAAFQAELSQQGVAEEAQWAALRALIWAAAATRLASGGVPQAATLLAAACVLPAAAQLAAMAWRWPLYRRHHAVASSLAKLASDVAGFATMRHLYAATAEAAAASPWCLLRQTLQFSCHAAAYLALSTLRSGGTFVLRLACASVALLAELCAARTVWSQLAPAAAAPGSLAAPDGASTAADAVGCQLACVALLGAAYCLPLCTVYRREVGRRVAFARSCGRRVDASHLDAVWDPLGFVVPALAQVISLWSYLG